MPPFTEKESSILAVLKKKSGRMSAQEAQREARVQARENSSVPPPDKAQVAQVQLQADDLRMSGTLWHIELKVEPLEIL